MTWDDSQMKLYLDGVLVDTQSSDKDLIGNTGDLHVSTKKDGNDPFNGTVDDLVIHDRALSADEDTLTGFENVTGSDHWDTLTGASGDNVLSGGTGGDSIDGGARNDEIHAGDAGPTVGPADAIMAKSPTDYWRLGDSGSTATDETGNSNGTYYGASTGAAGVNADNLVRGPRCQCYRWRRRQ